MLRRVAACRLLLSGDLASGRSDVTHESQMHFDGTNANGSSALTHSQPTDVPQRTAAIEGSSEEPGFAASKSSAAAARRRFRDLGGRSEVSIYRYSPSATHLNSLALLQTAHSNHC